MTKRDRQIAALIFAIVWLPVMAGAWWFATVLAQATVGAVLVLNDVQPGPIINEIPSSADTLVFAFMALGGLVLGCLGCRYAPEPFPMPMGPPPYSPPSFR